MITVSIIATTEDCNKYLEGCLSRIPKIWQVNILVNKLGKNDTEIIKTKEQDNITFYSCVIKELNFARLRNAIDQFADNEWILSLDMDDILLYEANELAEIHKMPKYIGGLYVNNIVYDETKNAKIVPQVKLYRNYGFEWKNLVHEQIAKSIVQKGFQIQQSSITTKHIGYITSQDNMIKKLRRNIDLCLKQLTTEKNPYIEYMLGISLNTLIQLDYYKGVFYEPNNS